MIFYNLTPLLFNLQPIGVDNVRVARDQSKVDQDMQKFPVEASRIGGDMNQNSRLVKQAQERVERSALAFTACATSGFCL